MKLKKDKRDSQITVSTWRQNIFLVPVIQQGVKIYFLSLGKCWGSGSSRICFSFCRSGFIFSAKCKTKLSFFLENFIILSEIWKIRSMTLMTLTRKIKQSKLALLWLKVKQNSWFFPSCVKLEQGSGSDRHRNDAEPQHWSGTPTCWQNWLGTLVREVEILKVFVYNQPGLRIRIHFIRIRIQHFRLNTNSDPDPIRIQGFNDQKLENKNQKLDWIRIRSGSATLQSARNEC